MSTDWKRRQQTTKQLNAKRWGKHQFHQNAYHYLFCFGFGSCFICSLLYGQSFGYPITVSIKWILFFFLFFLHFRLKIGRKESQFHSKKWKEEWMNEGKKVKFVYNFISLSLEIHIYIYIFPFACQSLLVCIIYYIIVRGNCSGDDSDIDMKTVFLWLSIALHCIQTKTPHPLRHFDWHSNSCCARATTNSLWFVFAFDLMPTPGIENRNKKYDKNNNNTKRDVDSIVSRLIQMQCDWMRNMLFYLFLFFHINVDNIPDDCSQSELLAAVLYVYIPNWKLRIGK